MKAICYLIMVMMIYSCKSSKIENTLIGSYHKKLDNYECTLSLNNDKTFILDINTIGGSSGCEGSWSMVDDNLIMLNCNEPSKVSDKLQGGYMNKRNIEVKVSSKDQLLFGEVILDKVTD